MTDNELMKGIKSLEEFKKQFKHTSKDKIIEMFYEMGLELIKLNKCCDSSEVDGNNLYFFDKDKFIAILNKCKGNMSFEDYGKSIGVDGAYLWRIVNKKKNNPPSPKILRKIAENSNDITTYKELMKVCGYI